jgi:hypothetical protein
MAKFVSVPLGVVKKIKAMAKKNGADSILDSVRQHSNLHFEGVLKNKKLLDQAEAKGRRLFLRNEWRRLVQAATMKKPLGVKKTPLKLKGEHDFSGMNPFPEDQISAVRGRQGIVKETKGEGGRTKWGFKYAENKLPKAPSKRERRVEEEMNLASKRREHRERAKTNNRIDVIDYLLSR